MYLGYPWSTKAKSLANIFYYYLDDTLSFIANIFFLILLIEQLNFLYTICLIKLLIFCFILEFLIHGGGRKIRSMVLQVRMIYHFMVDIVYVCILTESVYYIVLYHVRHYLKKKRIHWEKQRSMEREREQFAGRHYRCSPYTKKMASLHYLTATGKGFFNSFLYYTITWFLCLVDWLDRFGFMYLS